MAHGFECKRCGHQEAAHDFPDDYPSVCKVYVSPDKRAEKRIWKAEEKERLANVRTDPAIWMLTPYGFIDIGS